MGPCASDVVCSLVLVMRVWSLVLVTGGGLWSLVLVMRGSSLVS